MATESQRQSLTQSMQDLGLLHIEQQTKSLPEDAETLMHEQSKLIHSIRLLENQDLEKQAAKEHKALEIEELLPQLQKTEERLDKVHQEIEKLEKEANRLTPWGDYDYQKFEPLIARGLHIYLCSTDKKSFDKLDRTEVIIEKIQQQGSDIYFILFTDDADYHVPFECIPIPEKSPSILQGHIQRLVAEQLQLRATLKEYVVHLPALQSHLRAINDKLSLVEIQASFDELFEGKLITIAAWFPSQNEPRVVEFLERAGVAWQVRDPQKDEDVPVVLKNGRYPKLFESITKIFDLPDYYETDLTPFLAVFYPILFAYCLGDAGYGFVLTLLMLAGYFSFLKTTRNVALLGIILGGVTMIVGLIKSGSIFGIALIPDHPAAWIRLLSQWVIIRDDSSFIFNSFSVALVIGVIQILTGIMLSIYNKFKYEGYAYAVSSFGKLLIVCSLIWIFLADMQGVFALDILGDVRKYTLFIGIGLVMFYHDINTPLLKRLGGSIMPLFFIFMGILGDVLSYVRLFALGLASSVLGLVVNQIGLQIMEGGVINMVIGVLFLLFGHTLNFGIAALGSFVHPLRLTFVEFYGNVGFQGKGLEYRPFTKSKQTFNL